MTYFGTATPPAADGLPSRRSGGEQGWSPAPKFGTTIDPMAAALAAVRSELADLRLRVPGVRGAAVGGVDGLLITHDLPPGLQPADLAALAATTFGLGRQTAMVLGQSPFRDATLRSEGGYFTVYAVDANTLLSVLGDDGINVARLHLEARPAVARLAALLPQ
ncbi:roadblock/LC7 domain-containing protein [Dactylosporangium sp. NPDC051541]|uniref:roadblock/LC7 domain-containing protein n=1 Tax=Dactylosporangium sp. NPDC051541 TaxID=3363977 RepID=UPI0037A36CCE